MSVGTNVGMSADAMARLTGLMTRPYKYLRLEWSAELQALRVRTFVKPIQCYSLAGLTEMQRVLDDLAANPGLVRHLVLTSDVTGVFNFGGDLSLFVLLIRARDIESLRLYGRRCVDLIWWLENASSRGVHTTVLVQGDTLGGGLESVMPFHKVIFERSAQAGFPEVLFNLFPGMGAWNFVIRKAGFQVANEMILSGRLYTADQLFRRHLVDLVVEDGEGEAAIEAVLQSVNPRLRGTLAALEGRRMTSPITSEADGAPRAGPGAQGRWRERRRGRRDQAPRARPRVGRGAHRRHGVGCALAGCAPLRRRP